MPRADTDPGQQAINFFYTHVRHTKGQFAGRRFDLLPWQEKIIRDVFGTVNPRTGKRRYRQAYIEVPKKQGKSSMSAGIALYMLFCDGERGAEIYSAAATREQASLVFREAEAMVRQNPLLLGMVDIVPSSKLIVKRKDPTCFYKAISADAGSQDGINPHGVIFDELHRQKSRDLWDVLSYGSDVREQPLLFAITTAGIKDESAICWEQHERAKSVIDGVTRDATLYPVIYGAEEGEDWTKEEVWLKANPSMVGNPGGFMPIEPTRVACAEAQRSPLKENSFRRFRLNQWVSQDTRWIPLEEWDKCGEGFNIAELDGRKCYGGLDLSTTLDLTALSLLFPSDDHDYLLTWFWLPQEGIEKKEPRSLAMWARQGFITATPGNVVDYGYIRRVINDLADVYNIVEIGHDPWNATQLALELSGDGVEMIPVRQGFGSLSAPSKEFETRVYNGRIRHGGNPVLRWNVNCCSVRQDPAENIKPVKPDRTTSNRIDGVVASIMALGQAVRHEDDLITADSISFG